MMSESPPSLGMSSSVGDGASFATTSKRSVMGGGSSGKPPHATSDSSGYHSYSPIGTLERQYAQPPGKRVLLFVRTNPNIYMAGGVETILKNNSGGAGGPKLSSSLSSPEETGAASSATFVSGDPSSFSTSAAGTPVTTASVSGSTTAASDPFSFLGEDSDDEDQQPMTSSMVQEEKKKGGGPGIGRFLKKVAKSTTKTLERGMTNLAIRADGGKSPDWFVIGVYHAAATTVLLSMTESKPIPMDDTKKFSGLRFEVPLVVPGHLADLDTVVVKVWIRSGAAMLHNRHYLIGQVALTVHQLRSVTMSGAAASFLTLTLQSHLVADGKLFLCVTPDGKFPPLCGPGWSLADPDVRAYTSTNMFHWPLDQAYGMPFPPSPNAAAAWLTATERSVESSVVLPIAAALATLCATAGRISLAHAESVSMRVHGARHDSTIGEYIDCTCTVGQCKLFAGSADITSAFCAASWQRPDSIFEVDLLQPARLPITSPQEPVTWSQSLQFRFFPKPVREDILPSALQASNGQMPGVGFFLGTVRLQVTLARYASVEAEVLESVVSLETLLQQAQPAEITAPMIVEFPLLNTARQQVGTIAMAVTMKFKQGPPLPARADPMGGFVSLMGLTPLCDALHPDLDGIVAQELPGQPQRLTRQQHQLATMGMFYTHAYTSWHCKALRGPNVKELEERATRYNAALIASPGSTPDVPSHEDRNPKPFRPSSSRMELLLAGLPFNVHTASFSLAVMDPESNRPDKIVEGLGGVFCNVTCGAPADHAREFHNIFPKTAKEGPNTQTMGLTSPIGAVSGGLRRLEKARLELAKRVSDLQMTLTMQVANFFIAERQARKTTTHVPSRHDELQSLRWHLFEAVQSLHHVTWHIAMRRSSCFSQALGTAVTSFLASLSDPLKWQSTWPEIWAKHGYLVTFEGLLSSAGKELGMIEDAAVGISMLRQVSIILRSDDSSSDTTNQVPVVASPYLKWVRLQATHSGMSGTVPEYILEIGVVPSYYEQRIPAALQNGTPVRLYPLLFEVGVDIHQWRVHAMKNKTSKSESMGSDKTSDAETPVVTLVDADDDMDDDAGFADDDVLVEINYEAYNKLNMYAHSISPVSSAQSSQRVHPRLELLYQHIVTSSGKMNHVILDEAAALSQQLGGGGIVFCKSGKDRTAMHVTYKQAQYANKFRHRTPPSVNDATAAISSSFENQTISDATIIRTYGTRLPICEKNVGQAKYAFNSLQVKFMPEALKPPSNTLAGFLKGGKVFQGGGIES